MPNQSMKIGSITIFGTEVSEEHRRAEHLVEPACGAGGKPERGAEERAEGEAGSERVRLAQMFS